MGSRAGLDAMAKGKIPSPCPEWNSSRTACSLVAILTELPNLPRLVMFPVLKHSWQLWKCWWYFDCSSEHAWTKKSRFSASVQVKFPNKHNAADKYRHQKLPTGSAVLHAEWIGVNHNGWTWIRIRISFRSPCAQWLGLSSRLAATKRSSSS
jgi:hypothetical protein